MAQPKRDYSQEAAELKSRVGLRQFVASHPKMATSPQQARKQGHGRVDFFFSPFGAERTPSFCVNDDGWIDYHAGITKAKDVIDFLMIVDGMTPWQALDSLHTWIGSNPPASAPRVYQAADKPASFDEDKAKKIANFAYNHIGDALPYLGQRGISEEIAHRFRFGLMDWTYSYESPIGEVKLQAKRVTIPYLATTKDGVMVREVNARAHVPSCWQAWCEFQKAEPKKAASITNELFAMGYSWGTMRDGILKEVLGPRYHRWGNNDHIWNADALIKVGSDGKPQTRRLTQIAILEGEFDAALLEGLGIRAVAIPKHNKTPIERLFQMVNRVFVPFDNDEAGEANMEAWREKIGSQKTVPIPMPKGIKDVSQFWQDMGKRKLVQHLAGYGLIGQV